VDLPGDLLERSVKDRRVCSRCTFWKTPQRPSDICDANDPETLHDFPVSLRWLRSCLRAYGEELKDSVPMKAR
jgi:CHAD domain-containing protein